MTAERKLSITRWRALRRVHTITSPRRRQQTDSDSIRRTVRHDGAARAAPKPVQSVSHFQQVLENRRLVARRHGPQVSK